MSKKDREWWGAEAVVPLNSRGIEILGEALSKALSKGAVMSKKDEVEAGHDIVVDGRVMARTVSEAMAAKEPSPQVLHVDLEKRKKVLNRLADHRRWYTINNKAGTVATVRIYDEIGWFGVTAEDFVLELDEISAPEIIVAINCPGGDVFDGIAIYNALRSHPAKITTRVDSLAASAASVIVQAGDHRVMLSASQQMIHDAWGLSIGNSADMRTMADLLDVQSDVIAGIYATRSGKDAAHFRELMKTETWLTDEKAVEEGLADEVVEPSGKVSPPPANKTLNDEISEAMDVVSDTLESAERVAAHRAEQGKSLTQVNASSLDELARNTERIRDLLVQSGPKNEDLLALKARIEVLRTPRKDKE